MKKFMRVLALLGLILTESGCTPDITDDAGFTLHYYDIVNVVPGNTANTYPSYIGGTPADFDVYRIHYDGKVFWHPKLDGPLEEVGIFYMNPQTGYFSVVKSNSLKPGNYSVSFTCKVNGTVYDFPHKINIQVL